MAKKMISEYGGKEKYANAKAKAMHEKKEGKKVEAKEGKMAKAPVTKKAASPAKKCGPAKMKKY
jgi:hypothetical protein